MLKNKDKDNSRPGRGNGGGINSIPVAELSRPD
jgi:hypothetical protein